MNKNLTKSIKQNIKIIVTCMSCTFKVFKKTSIYLL